MCDCIFQLEVWQQQPRWTENVRRWRQNMRTMWAAASSTASTRERFVSAPRLMFRSWRAEDRNHCDAQGKVQIPDDTRSWAVRGLDLKRQQNNINVATQLVLWASGNDCLRGLVYTHWAQKRWFFSSKGKAALSQSEWRAPGSWFTKAFCRWL